MLHPRCAVLKQTTRRHVIAVVARAAAGIAIAAGAAMVPGCAAAGDEDFDFLLLGDTHLDQIAHHDMAWLTREKPEVIPECRAYCRITKETTPLLFGQLRRRIESNGRIRFVCQLGDLTEGLAGTPELARQHHADAVAFVRNARLGVPFLLTKGNHDRAGPGAPESFDALLRPFIAGELGALYGRRIGDDAAGSRPRDFALQRPHACYAHSRGNTLLVHFDGFSNESLDWLEQILAGRREKHLILFIHYPLVPYSPRSTWCLYAQPSKAKERTRLLNLLGEHRAIVLSAHLHDFGIVVRRTDRGSFVQVATCSVLPSLPAKPARRRSGLENYGGDIVEIDPEIKAPGPANTKQKRREFLEAERPFLCHYEYAIAPGYALISVRDDGVGAQFFCGLDSTPWREVNLTGLLPEDERQTPHALQSANEGGGKVIGPR